MNAAKRDKKQVAPKPTKNHHNDDHHKSDDDCTCTLSSSSSSSTCDSSQSDHHDSSHNNNHVQKYDECCEVKKTECKTHCKRKCRTICVVECYKDVNYRYEWAHHTKCDEKWKPVNPLPLPEKCHEKKDRK